MRKFSSIISLIGLLTVFSFFALDEAQASCLDVPLKGNYTLNTSCTFDGTVNGVDEGNLTIPIGTTLTINANQTIAWNPGYAVFIKGSIAINQDGGQLKKAYLWLHDADNDTYPPNNQQVASGVTPSGAKRRGHVDFTTTRGWTYLSQIDKYDYDDLNSAVYPGTNCGTGEECGLAQNDGTCSPIAAGEQGLPACKRCDGSSSTVANITTYYDSEGSNTCAGTCAAYCSSGSCVSADSGTGTCIVSSNSYVGTGGDGHCTSASCVADCYANGTACSVAGECCSGYCYDDADGDGYAPSSGTKTCRASSQLAGIDCCDSNANAHPNQTNYFTSAMASPCSGYDYNCSGTEERQAETCTRNRTCTTSGTQYACHQYQAGGSCPTFVKYGYDSCTEGGLATASCGESWSYDCCATILCFDTNCVDPEGYQYSCGYCNSKTCACR